MNESTLISPPRSRPLWLSLIGLFIAFIGLAGAWFEPVTRPRLSAWGMGIGLGPAVPGWLAIFVSFGLVGFLLTLWGALAAWRGDHLNVVRASMAMLLIGVAFVVHLALGRPIWLQYAMDGAVDFTRTMSFANKFNLPIAFLISPGAGMTVDQQGWTDRFSVAFMTLRFGWYWFIFGSVVAMFTSLTSMVERSPVLRGLLPIFLISGFGFFLMTAGALVAQAETRWGDQAAARNDLVAAERNYRSAIAWDEWYRVRPILYFQIGSLHLQRGDGQSPEASLYEAIDNGTSADYAIAMNYFGQALQTHDPDMGLLVRREMADREMEQGLSSYAAGQQGDARKVWSQMLQLRPKQVAGNYMMGQADIDLGDWDEAAGFYQKALANSTNDTMRAVSMAAWGDCFYRAGAIGPARAKYLLSMKIEPNTNFRALKSLTEYYYR